MAIKMDTALLAIDQNTIHFGPYQIPAQYITHFDVLDGQGVNCIRLWANRTAREGYASIITLHCQTEEKTREAAKILLQHLPIAATPFSSIKVATDVETGRTLSVTFAYSGHKAYYIQLSDYFSPENFEIAAGRKLGSKLIVPKDPETNEIDAILEIMNRRFANNHIADLLRKHPEPEMRCSRGSLGHGKKRWFEVYPDKITRRYIGWEDKSIEEPSSQEKINRWFSKT